MQFENRYQTDRQMQVSLIPIGVQMSIRINRIVMSVEWALGSLGADRIPLKTGLFFESGWVCKPVVDFVALM